MPVLDGLVHDHEIVRVLLFFDEEIDGAPGTGGAFVVPSQLAPQSDHPAVFKIPVSASQSHFGPLSGNQRSANLRLSQR